MDETTQQCLDMLDEAAAIIQELVAQVQSKGNQPDMNKKAELLAVKTGISFTEASDMIKKAEESGSNLEAVLQAADFFVSRSNASFGRVAGEENNLVKTGSASLDKYQEREAALMDELGL